MTGSLGTALTPVVIALAIVAVVVLPVLVGKGIRRADSETPGWPSWLADLDLGDDGADTKRTPATVAAAVVDELAQRRAVQS